MARQFKNRTAVRQVRRRLLFEQLEVRRLLATLHVGTQHPYKTIQSAHDAARYGDIVAIAAETFEETVEVVNSGITFQGSGPGTVLDAGRNGPAFSLVDATAITIRDMTITNGAGTTNLGGGAIRAINSDFFLTGSELHNNCGVQVGGAISVTGAGSHARIFDSKVFDNFTHSVAEHCVVDASLGGYGTIFVADEALATISGTHITNNRNWNAGAVYVGNPAIPGNPFAAAGRVILHDSLIKENSADRHAGVVFTDPAPGSSVIKNVIADNVAGFGETGGGLRIEGGEIEIRNNTITGNATAPANEGFGVQIMGLADNGAVTLANNIITGNDDVGVDSPIIQNDYNLLEFQPTPYKGGIVKGPNSIDGDPLFRDPAANDYTLVSGSPAINAGVDLDGKSTNLGHTGGQLLVFDPFDDLPAHLAAKLNTWGEASARYFFSPIANNLDIGFTHSWSGTGLFRTCDVTTGQCTEQTENLDAKNGSHVVMNEITLRFNILALAYKMNWLSFVDPGQQMQQSWGQILLGLQTLNRLQERDDDGGFANGLFYRFYWNYNEFEEKAVTADIVNHDPNNNEQSSDDNGLPYLNLLVLRGLALDPAVQIDANIKDEVVRLIDQILSRMELRHFNVENEIPFSLSEENGVLVPSRKLNERMEPVIAGWDRASAEGVPILAAMLAAGEIGVDQFHSIAASLFNFALPAWSSQLRDDIRIEIPGFHAALFQHGLRPMHGLPVTQAETDGATFFARSTGPVTEAQIDNARANNRKALGTQVMSQNYGGPQLTVRASDTVCTAEMPCRQARYAGNEFDEAVEEGDSLARATAPHAFFVPLARFRELQRNDVLQIFDWLEEYEDHFFHQGSDTELGWEAAIPWRPDDTTYTWPENPEPNERINYTDNGRPFDALNSAYIVLSIFDALNPDQPLSTYNAEAAKMAAVVEYFDSGIPIPNDLFANLMVRHTEGATMVAEGGAGDEVTIRLASPPQQNVTVSISGGGRVLASPASVTFTPSNWNEPVQVSLAADNNLVHDGDQAVPLIIQAASGHAAYDGLQTTLDAAVIDNDVPALTLAIAAGSVTESDGPAATTATITRNDADLSSSLAVMLASSDATEATVPPTVIIPADAASVEVDITAIDDNVADGTQNVTITATAPNYTSGSDTLPVMDNEPFALSLVLAAASVTEDAGLSATTATVSRDSSNLGAPLTVSLASSDNTEAVVAPTVVIPANSASATFSITIVDDVLVDGTQAVTITASAAGYQSAAGVLQVLDHEVLTVSIVEEMIVENAGLRAATGIVTRGDTDRSQPLSVTLFSDDTSEVDVPASVTIPANASAIDFPIHAIDDAFLDGIQNVTIHASAAGYESDTARIDVEDHEFIELTLDVASISEASGTATATVRHSATGLPPALNIALSASDPSEVSVPATVGIPFGQSAATFTIAAVDDDLLDGPQVITLSAVAAGFQNGAAQLTVDDHEFLEVTVATSVVSEPCDDTAPAPGHPQLDCAGLAPSTVQATVQRSNIDIGAPLTVSLATSDMTETDVPTTVVIPAGRTSAAFPIAAQGDELLDGTQDVRIAAAATGYVPGATSVTVEDFEWVGLELAEAIVSEHGPGTTGRVVFSVPPAGNPTVNLASSDPTEATVGQATPSNGEFLVDIQPQDDDLLDGTQVVAIQVSSAGYASATSHLEVTDHETLTVTINPAHVAQTGTTATGTVTRNNSDIAQPLVVLLTSSSTEDATVPQSVPIFGGHSSATFAITGQDDRTDGMQRVSIQASASGYESGAAVLTVIDHPFPWQNPANPLDVNGDQDVSPIDALVIINEINANGSKPLPVLDAAPPPYFDVMQDNHLAPSDVLVVINHLNNPGEDEEGESLFVPLDAKPVLSTMVKHSGQERSRPASRPSRSRGAESASSSPLGGPRSFDRDQVDSRKQDRGMSELLEDVLDVLCPDISEYWQDLVHLQETGRERGVHSRTQLMADLFARPDEW